MNPQNLKRKLTAVFSTDVVGYSRLMGEDEMATVETLTSYKQTMGNLIRHYRGRVVDSTGDNLLAEFASVVDAVQCAVEVQQVLRTKNEALPENRRMHFRIGINLGDVIEEGEVLYGDGVNIAARVESLAEAGGICISGSAFEQIENKLALGYQYMGEHAVKNIVKPIKVYKVPMEPGAVVAAKGGKALGRKKWAIAAVAILIIAGVVLALWQYYWLPATPPVEVASIEKMAYPLPDKASIAVLPFVNISGDPGQEYISDGISESIITALCKIPEMFVIAPTSTSTYKGKSEKIKQVSEELGVRYVLEGSVQKTGDRIRVTAQLIDAITGHHLWADRYDRDTQGFFVVLDEIARKVAIELQVKLTEGEQARMSQKTKNFEAWGYATTAYSLFRYPTKENIARIRELAEKAIELGPEYAFAWGVLGATHYVDVLLRYTESRDKSFALAVECIDKSLKLDETLPCSTGVKARLHMMQGHFDQAIALGEKAIALGPSQDLPYYVLGFIMGYAGRFEEAIALMKKAMRLNPCYPANYLREIARNYFLAGRYEEAVDAFKKTLELDQKGGGPVFLDHLGLSAVYMELGREQEARTHASEVIKINPKVSLENLRKGLYSYYKDPAHGEKFLSALHKAGLPETPPLPLPDKPSIAVLPFVNMSGDSKQEYFSDGITEEIITSLSRVPNLFVIARNSTFTYKGKSVWVPTVGKELGVRYVLEGSVRQDGDKVRVTTQLIDSQTNNHVWADRYDRELRDIFEIQDEITLKVITALQVRLTEGEQARLFERWTKNLDVYLKILEARDNLLRPNVQTVVAARRLAKEAIAKDPACAAAYRILGGCAMQEITMGVSKSPRETLMEAIGMVQKGLAMDESLSGARGMLAFLYTLARQYDKAIAEAEQGVAFEPNSADGHAWLAYSLRYAGRHQEAISSCKTAIRLNPMAPEWYFRNLGLAYSMTGEHEEAIHTCREAVRCAPDSLWAHVALTMAYGYASREAEARQQAAEVLRLNPKFSLDAFAKRALTYKKQEERDMAIDVLRKAGLPE